MDDIECADRLAGLFGHWPDFHDAEIRDIHLSALTTGGAVAEISVEVAEMSSDLDERGYFRDRVRAMVTMRFENVLNLSVTEFRYQNVLDELIVRPLSNAERADTEPWGSRALYVEFVPIPAFCTMTFHCDRAVVLSATIVERAP